MGKTPLPNNLAISPRGMFEKSVWQRHLDGYPTSLLCALRSALVQRVETLAEKFNKRGRYFGYRRQGTSDSLYVYVQKKRLVVDIRIDRSFERELTRKGFVVQYRNNFQGRSGWLTGWRIPHEAKGISFIVDFMARAFL